MPRTIPAIEQKILEAAAAVFERLGYTGADVRSIAQEAGVSVGSIYAKFGSKADLFWLVTERWREELQRKLELALASPQSAIDRLILVGKIIMEAIAEKHGLWKEFFSDPDAVRRWQGLSGLVDKMEEEWRRFSRAIGDLMVEAAKGPALKQLVRRHPERMALVYRSLVSLLPVSFPGEENQNAKFLRRFLEILLAEGH